VANREFGFASFQAKAEIHFKAAKAQLGVEAAGCSLEKITRAQSQKSEYFPLQEFRFPL
jgi:hypothetical protein